MPSGIGQNGGRVSGHTPLKPGELLLTLSYSGRLNGSVLVVRIRRIDCTKPGYHCSYSTVKESRLHWHETSFEDNVQRDSRDFAVYSTADGGFSEQEK